MVGLTLMDLVLFHIKALFIIILMMLVLLTDCNQKEPEKIQIDISNYELQITMLSNQLFKLSAILLKMTEKLKICEDKLNYWEDQNDDKQCYYAKTSRYQIE